MAIRWEDQYPGQVGAATAAYPHGVPRNVSAPSAGDGTPWEEAQVKDFYGFLCALMDGAGVSHSAVPDTATASQYLQALQVLFLQVSQLESNGGTVLETTSRLTTTGLHGLRMVRDSTTLFTVKPGAGRHIVADDSETTLAADIQKDISATWSLGAAGGVVPAALHPVAASTMLRVFLVSKPDGTADIALDTSPVAANFFADANAIAAGFSDTTRYRRFAYIHTTAGSLIDDFVNLEQDPREFLWTVQKAVSMTSAVTANRVAINLNDECPPSTFAHTAMYVEHNDAGARWWIVTHVDQTDVVPSSGLNSFFANDTGGGADQGNGGPFTLPVSSNADFYVRWAGGGAANPTIATCTINGWRDDGIVV